VRYLSVCSGIEAATVAWHPLGWTPVAFSEIEPFPSAVLAHHYPQVPNLGDMTNHATWPLQPGDIDLLVGGTPCQSFSVAGLRKGLSDPRGGLMLTYLEIARCLRPRWVVWENVPGVLSSDGGRDFGSFLGALGELGYGWAYRVLDAQWVRTQRHPRAVPQRRRRVFVVGCLGDGAAAAAAAVLFERESVQRDSSPRRAKGEGAAADAADGAGAGRITSHDVAPCIETTVHDYSRADGFTMVADIVGAVDCRISAQRAQNAAAGHPIAVPIQDGRDIANKVQNGMGFGKDGDPAYTLTKVDAAAVAVTVSNGEPRVSDCMGTLDAARESRGSNQQRFVMQPVPFRKSKRAQSTTDDESWVEAEQANTLNAFDTGERDTHAVAFSPGNLKRGAGAGPNDEVFPTLLCRAGRGADDQRPCVAYPIDTQNMTEGHSSGGLGFGQDGDQSFTVTKGHSHAVAFAQNQLGELRVGEVTNTLNTNSNASGRNTPMVAHGFYSTGDVAATMTKASGGPAASEPAVLYSFHPTQDPINSDDGTTHCIGTGSKGGCSTVGVAQSMTVAHANGGGQIPSPPAVAFSCKDHGADAGTVAPTMRAMPHDGSHANGGGQIAVAQTMTVRRLTPRECERLQAFPDDYTMIPWRKKPADQCPDGPRYKALGNSMAVNCMEWIGERIAAYEAKERKP
jgi:site-specific DNA-cytosine methylase